MADAVLVSQSNLDILLKALKAEFLSQLSKVSVFTQASQKISILDIIKTTGTTGYLLADDGTYKDPRTADMITITTKTNQTWTILNIKQDVNGKYYPDIPEYQNIINMINATPVKTTGDGSKFLNDAGLYVDVKVYRGLNSSEISTLCADIKGGIL